jgi:flavin reductase (DIM6/NTAB) family NADH-FMN oxidoreductase RutF
MFVKTGQPHRLRYNPVKACVVPRPIGWISSVNAAGTINLAPFSFFNMVSADPPLVVYCTNGAHAEGGWKDSLANVAETREFVANVATWTLREKVNLTSLESYRHIDEMRLAQLTPAPSSIVAPPGVSESPIRMECRLHQILELPVSSEGAPNHAVFGHIVGIFIDEAVMTDGMVDVSKLEPIARLGYMDYAVVRETFRMIRPHPQAHDV